MMPFEYGLLLRTIKPSLLFCLKKKNDQQKNWQVKSKALGASGFHYPPLIFYLTRKWECFQHLGEWKSWSIQAFTKKAMYEGWVGDGGAWGAHTSPYPSWPWTLGQRNLIQERSVDRSKFKSFGVPGSNLICHCKLRGGALGTLPSSLGDSVSSLKP